VKKPSHDQIDWTLLNSLISANKGGAAISDIELGRLGVFANAFTTCAKTGAVWEHQSNAADMHKLVEAYHKVNGSGDSGMNVVVPSGPSSGEEKVGAGPQAGPGSNPNGNDFNSQSGTNTYFDNRQHDVNIKDNNYNKDINNNAYDDHRKYTIYVGNGSFNANINNNNVVDQRQYENNQNNNNYITDTNTNTNYIRGGQQSNETNNNYSNTNNRIVLRGGRKPLKSAPKIPSKVAVCKAARRKFYRRNL